MILFIALALFTCSLCGNGVKRYPFIVLLAIAPVLMAALWMDKQPTPRTYRSPVVASPVGSIPVTGREQLPSDTELAGQRTTDKSVLATGKRLFSINCEMCHGATSTQRGAVGLKLNPPPPGLDRTQIQQRSDAHLYRVITLGFGRMPPFRNRLDRSERLALINYLRSRN
jgi:mono/diheme cytochrome c family protein